MATATSSSDLSLIEVTDKPKVKTEIKEAVREVDDGEGQVGAELEQKPAEKTPASSPKLAHRARSATSHNRRSRRFLTC